MWSSALAPESSVGCTKGSLRAYVGSQTRHDVDWAASTVSSQEISWA